MARTGKAWAMMHQMNRSATAGKLEDPDGFRRTPVSAPLPAGGLTPRPAHPGPVVDVFYRTVRLIEEWLGCLSDDVKIGVARYEQLG